MKIYSKPLQFSLIFHGIILLAVINVHMSPVSPQNIVVVDFSMDNEPLLRNENRTATVSTPLMLQKNQKNRQPIAIIQNQQNEEQKPFISSESSDMQDIQQKDPHTPVMALNQTNLDTKMSLSEFSHYGSQSSIRDAEFPKTNPSGPSKVGEGDVIASENSRYIKAHFSYIKDLIHKHLIYPAQAKKMGWEGKVIVSFIISSGGQARDIMLSKSSGHEILDDNALKAVRIAAPFPKPPVEAQIIVPVLYRLN